MNHQERLELLGALSRAGVSYYKSHDLEVKFGGGNSHAVFEAPQPQAPVAAPISIQENTDATQKLTDLIETLKMDDASLVDKIFPAGAGG